MSIPFRCLDRCGVKEGFGEGVILMDEWKGVNTNK